MEKKIFNIGAVATEKTLNNKTGSWRTFKPVINDKCTGCAICVDFCPDICISMVKSSSPKFKQKADINYDYCKGCLICKNVCPFNAIDKESEK